MRATPKICLAGLFSTILLAVLAGLSTVPPAHAFSSYLNAWRGIYPGSTTDDTAGRNGCQVCHGPSNGRWNPYGNSIRSRVQSGMAIEAAIMEVAGLDADTDPTGSDNVTEITANAQPGWTPGPNNPIYQSDGTFDTFVDPIMIGVLPPLDPDAPNEPPTADPGGPYSGVAGVNVMFDGTGSSDPDGSIASYDWDFGDGAIGSGPQPQHAYLSPGIYDVTLTVTDDAGDSSAPAATTATIDALNQLPTADPNGPYSGTVDVPLTFDGSGSTDPDGSIVAYDWEFGDGATGNGPMPTHTYTVDGTFTVTLTVTDDAGDTSAPATTTATIALGNQPPVADPNGPYSGTVGVPLAFDGSGSTDPDGTIVFYDWDFGDGTIVLDAGPTPDHTYTLPGLYNVTLSVTDDGGATDSALTTADVGESNRPPVADPNGPYSGTVGVPLMFDGTGSSDPDGTIVAYDWDFGDGATGNGPMPTHIYGAAGNFTVTLTVTDDAGDTSAPATTIAAIGAINQAPTADPGGPYTGVVGVNVMFDGTGSFDPDGTITSYDWDFGDGATGNGPQPQHAYAAPGVYDVSLTVTDNAGDSSAPAVTTATIDPANQLPTADPNGPYSGTVDVPLTFDGSGSTDPDGTIVAYDWDFGDGATGNGPMPTHTYAAEGNFTVTLTVTDDTGDNSAPATTTATIALGNQPPVADPDGPYSGTVGEPVAFDGTASVDPDGTIVAYDWDFGDGTFTPGAGPTPTHSYAAAGIYNVTLSVTDDAGATDSAGTTADISAGNRAPTADAGPDQTVAAGTEVTLDGSGSSDPDGDALTYLWTLLSVPSGSGATLSDPTAVMPTFVADLAGEYVVELVVDDGELASAPDTLTIRSTVDRPGDLRITKAEWDDERSKLKVKGDGASPVAQVTITDADTGEEIGTVTANGGGKWKLERRLRGQVPCRVQAESEGVLAERMVEHSPACNGDDDDDHDDGDDEHHDDDHHGNNEDDD